MALSGCGHTDLPRHPNPVPAAPRTEKPAVARRIDDVQALLPGPVATGRRGDFRLGNGEVALVVMVRRKVPEDPLAPGDRIPSEIDGVPVDVQEVGTLRAQGV